MIITRFDEAERTTSLFLELGGFFASLDEERETVMVEDFFRLCYLRFAKVSILSRSARII